jgi:hypothetical protein
MFGTGSLIFFFGRSRHVHNLRPKLLSVSFSITLGVILDSQGMNVYRLEYVMLYCLRNVLLKPS